MIYDCKIIIKEDKWNDNCFFDIYIKYKPQNKIGFYKKYFILNEYLIEDIKKQIENLVCCQTSKIEKLKWFNNLNMEEIKLMLINYIKKQQNEESEEDKYEIDFQQQIKLAKEKSNKFTVEV